MRRWSNTVLKCKLKDNIDFAELKAKFRERIESGRIEYIHRRNESGRWVFFIHKPDKELFKWAMDFDIIRGCTYLWWNDKPVTKENYDKIPWEEMTNIPPVIEELE